MTINAMTKIPDYQLTVQRSDDASVWTYRLRLSNSAHGKLVEASSVCYSCQYRDVVWSEPRSDVLCSAIIEVAFTNSRGDVLPECRSSNVPTAKPSMRWRGRTWPFCSEAMPSARFAHGQCIAGPPEMCPSLRSWTDSRTKHTQSHRDLSCGN
jgi:hypothetical protein